MRGVSLSAFGKAACGALFALSLVFPATSRADVTYVQTSDHCDGGCGIDTSNTVTISQTAAQLAAGTVEIKVSLDNGYSFVTTGAGDASFAFSSSLSDLTLKILSATSSSTLWSTTKASSLKESALTYPATAYGLVWGGGTGGGKHDGGLLDFTVQSASTPGLTLASFISTLLGGVNGQTPTNALFAADVISPPNSTGPTGIIDFSASSPSGTGPSPVPAPALGAGLPGLIAACMGLVVFARRRRLRFA
jgi:hypothetical protein